MNDKPREFWIYPCKEWSEEDQAHTKDAIGVQQIFGTTLESFVTEHSQGIRLIERSAYEKLKAENERLLHENLHIENRVLNKAADFTTKRQLEMNQERDTLMAKLAEVEAAKHKRETEFMERFSVVANELTREREAARVMREALEYYASSVPLGREARVAIAKADEIRGGE